MRTPRRAVLGLGLFMLSTGCATSAWKLPGPDACRHTCESWKLGFAGMVAVGSQDPAEEKGATACICADPRQLPGASASAASMAGPVAASAAAASTAATTAALAATTAALAASK